MYAKRAIGVASKLIVAFMTLCLCATMASFFPEQACADESSEVPIGVLTLCDNPFEVDCGHDHGRGYSAEYRSGSEDGPQDALAAPAGPALSEPARDDDLKGASTIASNDSGQAIVLGESSNTVHEGIGDENLYRHEHGAVLVELEAGASRDSLEALIALAGGLSSDGVMDDDLSYGLVKLGITDGSSVSQTVNRLRGIPGISSVQPNYIYKVNEAESAYTTVDDYYASRQWELESVNAFAAWDIAKTMGSVAIAVIDTGVDLDHPDLAANIVAVHNSLSSTNTVEDQIGHGTHVAGIVSGVANNGLGIAGVSYNASLVVIKASAFGASEFDSASIVRAYEWLESLDSSGKTVAEHYNVKVVNMSIGGLDDTRTSNLVDDVLNKAIRKARDEYGLLTVVAAGNGSPGKLPYFDYPGDSDACISVMNLREHINEDDEVVGVELDDSSNYNVVGTRYKDICAPGGDIYSTWLNGKFAIDSGTSMAAPVVSGIAALLFAVNPYLTPQMAMSILEASATDLGAPGWDERYGYGEVNAAAALRIASQSRIDGYDVVGVGGKIPFSASLGLDLEEEPSSSRTWNVVPITGRAVVDERGVLTGQRAGTVTLISTCRASSGAEISAIKTVEVLKASISGENYINAGSASKPYSTTEPSRTWVWKVENDTGTARIDQDAILVAGDPGVVYVTATCASNTDIVIRKKVTIVA